MKQLTPSLVATVRTALKGKKLEKFDASIKILNDSLAQGSWVLRGSVKAKSGFYAGISNVDVDRHYEDSLTYKSKAYYEAQNASSVYFLLMWGQSRFSNDKHSEEKLLRGIKVLREHGNGKFKLTDEQAIAWMKLVAEKDRAFEFLMDARPKPVLTKILLSTKVTKTLKEMNLDIDIQTIKEPKMVVWKKEPVLDANGRKTYDRNGKQRFVIWWKIKWEKGCKHGQSRFADNDCHACGKTIPSRMFVPVEAVDKKTGGYVSLWLGCDCAKNIFGVKAVGIDKTKVKVVK